MGSYRFPGKAFDGRGEHVGPGPWLDLIHAANRIQDGLFGSPTHLGPWWAGGSVEEYPGARVIHHDDGTVTVAGLTDEVSEVLAAAAEAIDA